MHPAAVMFIVNVKYAFCTAVSYDWKLSPKNDKFTSLQQYVVGKVLGMDKCLIAAMSYACSK